MTDENSTQPGLIFTDAHGRIFMTINRDLTVTSALEDASEAGRAFVGSIRTELETILLRPHAPTELERKLARAMARVEQLSDHLGIPYVYETGHGPVRPSTAPPAYLAADLWDALGAPTSDFDAYYERNGWADTWSNLLGAVRDHFRLKCAQDVDGESCVLTAGHLPPHYGPSDVGSSEPVPVPDYSAKLGELLDHFRSQMGHAPTDDEREAHAERIVTRHLSRLSKQSGWAEDDTAIGGQAANIVRQLAEAGILRRSEVPEPSAEGWSTEDRREALGEALRRWSVQSHHDRLDQRDHDLYGMGARQGFALGAEWWKVRAGVVAAEPEWEYGWRSRFATGGPVFQELEWGSREQAEQSIRDHEQWEADDPEESRLVYELVKRTSAVRAGEWVPVKQEGAG